MTVTHRLDSSLGEIRVADAEQNLLDMLQKPSGKLLGGYGSQAISMLASPDGRLLVVTATRAETTNNSSTAYQLWSISDDDVRSFPLFEDHKDSSNVAAVLSPDGHWLGVSTDTDGLRLWDARHPDVKPVTLLAGRVARRCQRLLSVFARRALDHRTNNKDRFWLWDTQPSPIAALEYREGILTGDSLAMGIGWSPILSLTIQRIPPYSGT